MQEFMKRIRIAIAIMVGYVLGRVASEYAAVHQPEVFSGGFLMGVLVTQGLFKLWELRGRDRCESGSQS